MRCLFVYFEGDFNWVFDFILQIFSNVFGCCRFPHWNSALWRYQHNLHFRFHCSTVSPTRGTNRFNELFGPGIYWWFWNYFGFKPFRLNFHAGSNFIGQVIIVFAPKNAQAMVYWISKLLNYLINKLWIDSRLVPIEHLSGNSRERKFVRLQWSYDLDLTQSMVPFLHSWIRPLRWLSLLGGFEQAPTVSLKKSNPIWKRVNFTISGSGSSKLTAYPCPIYINSICYFFRFVAVHRPILYVTQLRNLKLYAILAIVIVCAISFLIAVVPIWLPGFPYAPTSGGLLLSLRVRHFCCYVLLFPQIHEAFQFSHARFVSLGVIFHIGLSQTKCHRR